MKRFSNILLIADAGADHSPALKRAVTLAKSNQASLTLVDIVDSVPAELQMAITAVTPEELRDIAATEKRENLDQIIKTIADKEIAVEPKVLVGRPFIEIIRQVLRNHHDLVIKCAEGAASLRDALFGSTDMHLMRKCPCPVWIIKSTERPQYRRILAAMDQDPEDSVKDALNRRILEMSTSLALAEFSELHFVHAWRLFGEGHFRSPRTTVSDAEVDVMVAEEANKRSQWLENLVSTYGTKADKDAVDYLAPQLHVIKGDPKHVVPAKARELAADLVVMGTVARTGIAGFFMGNTAESILTQLDCSVLTVKPPGFISPVTLEA
jgi:nucleotide-binding universal stress UspA family protein